MTHTEFNQLSKEEQSEVILANGTLLYRETNGNYFKEVYSIRNFIAEVSTSLSLQDELDIIAKQQKDIN